jgi:hypothetical protein
MRAPVKLAAHERGKQVERRGGKFLTFIPPRRDGLESETGKEIRQSGEQEEKMA